MGFKGFSFTDELIGEVTSRLTADCQTMSDTVGTNVNVFLRSSFMVVGALIVMFQLSWRLSFVTFIIIPLIGFVSRIYGTYFAVSFDSN